MEEYLIDFKPLPKHNFLTPFFGVFSCLLQGVVES